MKKSILFVHSKLIHLSEHIGIISMTCDTCPLGYIFGCLTAHCSFPRKINLTISSVPLGKVEPDYVPIREVFSRILSR